MIEEREFEGYWWVPGESDEKVGGVLNFSQENRIRLRLFSALSEKKDGFVEFDKIFGFTSDAKKITLENTLRLNYSDSELYDEEIMSTEHTADRAEIAVK